MRTFLISLGVIAILSGCATWKGVKKDSSDAWKATKKGTNKAYNATKEAIHEATD
ncbi:hypothetical protein [Halarcobacter bivalviorum]|uniref:Lipoprotein n=1 Tax=Halarcobacter bivalviorum TaxID=663364 RepID=A0AB33GI17_9BACT|nr:hypothetical protein [Halarcobacter bivalviorum]AXH12292.1 hypothetical protein ABIV_1292 [Halarcobacter bivalviorum]